MATPSKHEQIADDVLRGVGGEANVKSVTHCATRLRFQLHDRDKADKAAVEATKGVITVVEAAGQFQVVIGNNVVNVFEAITAYAGVIAGEGGTSGGFLAKAIDLITSIVLHDPGAADDDALGALPDVVMVLRQGGQLQVAVRTGVLRVHDDVAVRALTGPDAMVAGTGYVRVNALISLTAFLHLV